MQVRQVMSTQCVTIPADTSVDEAAAVMRDNDVGMLPVLSMAGTLVGVITDRDIAMRCVAAHRPADTVVSEMLSGDVECCHDDDSLQAAAARMGEARLRRMPVLDHDRHLVGVIGLADVGAAGGAERLHETFQRITTPTRAAREA